MKLWVDADGCPREIKQILFRASERLGIPVCLVANLLMPTPSSDLISSMRVPSGYEEADDYIVEAASPDDIVITPDIPLAARIVDNGGVALDPRGQLYDEKTVHDRLATRNLMDQLRASGLVHGGPAGFTPADKHRFAAALDRLLTKKLKP